MELIEKVPGYNQPETKNNQPEIKKLPESSQELTFAQAKALKKHQDSQRDPETLAAQKAIKDQNERNRSDHIAELERQAKIIADNPHAITGIPEHLK